MRSLAVLLLAFVLGGVPAQAMDLDEVMSLARLHDPDLRVQEELALQASLREDRAWLALSPTLNFGGSWTWNDPTVLFDVGEGFGSVGDALGQNSSLLGYAYYQMMQEGMLSDLECVQVGQMYEFEGVTDCASLQGAMLDAADQPPPKQSSDPIYLTPRNQWGYQLDLGWNLSPRLWASIAAARAQAKAGRARAQHGASQIRYGIYRAYVGLYQAQERVAISQEALAAAQRHLELEQARQKLGASSEIGVLRQNIEVLSAQQALSASQELHRSMKAGLAQRIDREGQELVVEEPPALNEAWKVLPDTTALDGLVSQAWEDRLDLNAARQDEIAARAGRVDSVMQWLPDFRFFLTVGDAIGRQDGQWLVSGFSDETRYLRLGVQANWALWDGGGRLVDAREAGSRLRVSRLLLKREHLTLRTELSAAVDSLKTAREQQEAALLRVDLAQQVLTMTEQRAAAGDASDLELADAALSHRLARLDALASRLALDDAAWKLEMLLGRR